MGKIVTPSHSGRVRALFSFPNPVNEYAARTVAAGVFVLCVAAIASVEAGLLVPHQWPEDLDLVRRPRRHLLSARENLARP